MKRRWLTLIAILLGLLCIQWPVPVAAEGDNIRTEPLLELVEQSSAIKLAAFAANGSIVCNATSCELEMEQTYWLHNTSLKEAVSLQIGLSKGDDEWEAEDISLICNGSPLPAHEGNERYAAQWEIHLLPNKHETLLLKYRHTLGNAAVLAASVKLDRIVSHWGLPDGARVRFVLPSTVTDDAILWMVPFISGFDGRQVTWDYETPRELISHQLVVIRLDIWQGIHKASADKDYRRLASLYLQIEQEFQPLGLPKRDYFGQAVACYAQAIKLEPDNPILYVELAQAYHTRAAEVPDGGLNYELLATEALEKAFQLAPDDSSIAQQLAQAYYAVAVASGNQGQQQTALNYLEKLNTSGLPPPDSEEALHALALRWSVELAEKGYNQIAFEQAYKLLPTNTVQMLNDFAPPFTGLQTQIKMAEGKRTVTYTIHLYEGTAERSRNQLEQLLAELEGIPGLTTQLEADTDAPEVHLVLEQAYHTMDELHQEMAHIEEIFSTDSSLLAAALRIPWQSAPDMSIQNYAGIRHSIYFHEEFVTSLLEPLYEEQSQYSQWRLVEMSSQAGDSELEQLQQRLVTYLLGQQQRIWRQIPLGCSWEYIFTPGVSTADAQHWFISWGEDRILEINTTQYNRPALTRLAIVSLIVTALAVLALVFPWKSLHK